MHLSTHILIGTGLLACLGCRPAAPPPLVTRVDSAGVEIVTSLVEAPPSPPWRVSRRPFMELGALDGPEEFTFGTIRAVGRLPDGRVFVGDEQAHLVRVFSEDGEYLRSFGGKGQGPGELQWFLTVASYRGDSLFVYDYAQRAVSVFGPTLEFGRRFQNPVLSGNYWIHAALPDGRFLLTSAGVNGFPGRSGLVDDSSFVILSAPDGSVLDTIGAFRITTHRVGASGRPEPTFFQPRGGAFVTGELVGWTDGGALEFVVVDADGNRIRIVRKPEEPVEVTAGTIAEFKVSYLELLKQNPEAPPERIRRMLEEAHYAPTLPSLWPTFLVDALGYIWVSRYHFEGQVATEWEVFDSSGMWVGRMTTPEGLTVHEIGPTEIMGVALGEFDVPYVQLYRLERN